MQRPWFEGVLFRMVFSMSKRLKNKRRKMLRSPVVVVVVVVVVVFV